MVQTLVSDAGRFVFTEFDGSEMNGVMYYVGGTTMGVGANVFKDAELKTPRGDGEYRNDTNSLTVSGGVVSTFQ